MSGKILYQSMNYSPERVAAKYIRFDAYNGNRVILFECNEKNLTLRESVVPEDSVDQEKLAKAKALVGHWPNQVQIG